LRDYYHDADIMTSCQIAPLTDGEADQIQKLHEGRREATRRLNEYAASPKGIKERLKAEEEYRKLCISEHKFERDYDDVWRRSMHYGTDFSIETEIELEAKARAKTEAKIQADRDKVIAEADIEEAKTAARVAQSLKEVARDRRLGLMMVKAKNAKARAKIARAVASLRIEVKSRIKPRFSRLMKGSRQVKIVFELLKSRFPRRTYVSDMTSALFLEGYSGKDAALAPLKFLLDRGLVREYPDFQGGGFVLTKEGFETQILFEPRQENHQQGAEA